MVYTVKIEPRPDQEKRDADDQEYRKKQLNLSWWLNLISGVGGGIAFLALLALVANAILIHQQNKISEASSDLAYRPYVGTDGISLTYAWSDAKGATQVSVVRVPQAKVILFNANVKNFGPVPGTHYVGKWRVFLGGTELPANKVLDAPLTIFPSQTMHFEGRIGSPYYSSIISGETQLVIEITVEYDGPSGHYKECDKQQFAPNNNAFMNLGACDVL